MKRKNYSISILLLASLLLANIANAQWTRNAGTQQTYTTFTGDSVGIGTTNPKFKLDVQGTGVTTMSFKSLTDNASILLDRGASTKTSSVTFRTNGVNNWQTGCVSNNNYTIRNNGLGQLTMFCDYLTNNIGIGTNVPANKLSVSGGADFTGNVGIGSSVPGFKLDVVSPDNNDATTIAKFASNDNTNAISINNKSISASGTNANQDLKLNAKGTGGVLSCFTNGTEQVRVNNQGDLELFGINNGSASTGFLRFGFAGSAGIASKGTATGNYHGLDFYTANINRMCVDSSGNVGVGTTSPTGKLEIKHNSTGSLPQLILNEDDADYARVNFKNNSGSSYWSIGALNNATQANERFSIYNSKAAADLMIITGSGNVGIGASSPGAKLEVNGQVKITGGSPGAGKVLTSDAAGLASWQNAAGGLSGSGTANAIAFWSGSTSLTANNTNLIWDNTNNRLGVGVSSPSAKLSVVGSATSIGSKAASIEIKNTATGGQSWYLNSGGSNTSVPGGFSIADGTGYNVFSVAPTGFIGFNTSTPGALCDLSDGALRLSNTTDSKNYEVNYDPAGGYFFIDEYGAGRRLAIANGGNVGIGTTSPAYKLDVCGTIRSKEVRVETGWCDYVFANDYKLKSLEEVDQYLKVNKHLPGIAPACEVESEGLKLGEMSKAMMEKIEELTLYVIKLDKENKQLKSDIEQLKK